MVILLVSRFIVPLSGTWHANLLLAHLGVVTKSRGQSPSFYFQASEWSTTKIQAISLVKNEARAPFTAFIVQDVVGSGQTIINVQFIQMPG